jgi:hypothetical protein
VEVPPATAAHDIARRSSAQGEAAEKADVTAVYRTGE